MNRILIPNLCTRLTNVVFVWSESVCDKSDVNHAHDDDDDDEAQNGVGSRHHKEEKMCLGLIIEQKKT